MAITINNFVAYACYLLGAALFLLDVIEKYKKMADANPDQSIVFDGRIFWKKEWVNIVRILLLGVASQILMIPLAGMSLDFINSGGDKMFNTSIKVILFPIYFVLGYSGGKATMAVAGKYKKELYNKVGITEP